MNELKVNHGGVDIWIPPLTHWSGWSLTAFWFVAMCVTQVTGLMHDFRIRDLRQQKHLVVLMIPSSLVMLFFFFSLPLFLTSYTYIYTYATYWSTLWAVLNSKAISWGSVNTHWWPANYTYHYWCVHGGNPSFMEHAIHKIHSGSIQGSILI